MNYSNGGIKVAKKLAPKLELLTGDQCTSRWHHSEEHEYKEFRKTIACTDVSDVARADYVICCPLTETSRGSHVEMGLGLGLDKPVYLYRPEGMDGTGFDSLCNEWKPEWIKALQETIAEISGEKS
jgi:nucleoside 2-deoxyribosyltransferase